MGDFNAKIGRDKSGEYVGEYGLGIEETDYFNSVKRKNLL